MLELILDVIAGIIASVIFFIVVIWPTVDEGKRQERGLRKILSEVLTTLKEMKAKEYDGREKEKSKVEKEKTIELKGSGNSALENESETLARPRSSDH